MGSGCLDIVRGNRSRSHRGMWVRGVSAVMRKFLTLFRRRRRSVMEIAFDGGTPVIFDESDPGARTTAYNYIKSKGGNDYAPSGKATGRRLKSRRPALVLASPGREVSSRN